MLANTPYKIVGENKSAVNALSEIAALQPDIVITHQYPRNDWRGVGSQVKTAKFILKNIGAFSV